YIVENPPLRRKHRLPQLWSAAMQNAVRPIVGPDDDRTPASTFSNRDHFVPGSHPPAVSGRDQHVGDRRGGTPVRRRARRPDRVDGAVGRSEGDGGGDDETPSRGRGFRWGWRLGGSNHGPEACKATALATERRPRDRVSRD